jgi:hypothetical protein
MSLLQNSQDKRKSSFRASEARPGIQDFKRILDSRFRGNDAPTPSKISATFKYSFELQLQKGKRKWNFLLTRNPKPATRDLQQAGHAEERFL